METTKQDVDELFKYVQQVSEEQVAEYPYRVSLDLNFPEAPYPSIMIYCKTEEAYNEVLKTLE